MCVRRREVASRRRDGSRDSRASIARLSRVSNAIRDDPTVRHRVVDRVRSRVRARDRTRSTRACRWIRYVSIDDRRSRSRRSRARNADDRANDAMVGSASRGRGNDPTRRHRSTFRSIDFTDRSIDFTDRSIDRLDSIGDRDRERGSGRLETLENDVGGRLIGDFVRGIRGGDATRGGDERDR